MSSEQNAHEPLVERVLVSFDLAAEHHIANCDPCQTERERLERALREFGAANREYAMRPENFWEQQAARIQAKRRESQSRARMAAVLTPTLATLLFAGVLLVHRAPQAEPAQTVPVVQMDSDHELLLAVERAVESNTPQALAPVAWMMENSEANPSLETNSGKKEMRSHEN